MKSSFLALAGLVVFQSVLAGTALADRVGGDVCSNTSVLAHSSDTYTEGFYAGRRATVSVLGDGDTDLDLYVYDERGNLITSDTDYTDRCVVTFTPLWTGRFTIRVVNLGSVYNNYTICTH